MRIGHYAHRLGARGGIASYIRRLGQAQSARGHTVRYLCRSLEANALPNGTEVQSDEQLLSAAQAQVDLLHLHRPVDPALTDRLPMIRTMHGHHGSCPSGSRYLKRPGQPCDRAFSVAGCLWGHLVDHCGSRRPHRIASNFRSIQHEQAHAAEVPTITVSRFVKEQMVRSGCPADNLHVVHSPAPDVEASAVPVPRRDPPHVVFAGRIEPKKGLDWLLRALGQTQADVHLDVAGTGEDDYMAQIHHLAAQEGVEDHVTFHGWLDEDAVYDLIREARALVFPSVWHEPAGLVTLEAAALGRPVIASEVGGIPEYATDDFALRASPRDVDGLAAQIDELATRPDLAERMGRRGRALATDRFSMDAFVERIQDLYRSLVLESGG